MKTQARKAVRLNHVTDAKQTKGTNTKIGIVTEVERTGKYGFIMPIIMEQRVFVIHTHITRDIKNKLLVGSNIEYN